MKKNYYLLFLFLSVTISSFSQSLVINEIITSNAAVNTDDDSSYEDWVELYNGTTQSINLEGYGLSDNTNPFKWVFPAKTILPGEHLLIWCSEKDRNNPDLPLHTNFKISASGETITLTNRDGTTADSYPPVIIPQNFTYGRATDGAANLVIFNVPTPGAANTTQGYTEILEEPQFSVPSGFYENSFDVNIATNTNGATIIYTLDGSEPDENNLLGTTYRYKNQYPQNPGDAFGPFLEQSFITYAYTSGITVQDRNSLPNKISAISSTFDASPNYIPAYTVPKSTVIRAKVIKGGALPSPTVTKNYFVSPGAGSLSSLPIVAVNTNEDKLFDYNDGIYVAGEDFDNWRTNFPEDINNIWGAANYKRSGDATEIEANFSYYNAGQEVVNQNVGVRLNGNFSRVFPNKAFRIYARSQFGDEDLSFPFFGAGNNDSFKTLILRNSGNDAIFTYFLDAFIQKSVSHLHLDTQDYQPAVTFVNGEYWGLLNLRERYDKHYFKRVYGIEEDDLDYLEMNMQLSVKEGNTDHYLNMMNFIENNSLSNEDNYTYVKTQLDPENFADYYIAEIFAANTDWPGNNMEFFRKKTTAYNAGAAYGNDGRWRWILKDTDHGFGFSNTFTHNTLAFATATDAVTNSANPAWATLLFRKLLENDNFKNYFITRFSDMLNTTFLPARMEAVYNELKSTIAPEIPRHIDRWVAMWSVNDWEINCNTVLEFARQRPEYQRTHIREKFGIANNLNVTLNIENPAHGYIKINTIAINTSTVGVQENPYPWTGIYFNNVPVTLKAVALPGYTFSHWSGAVSGTNAEITYTPAENFEVTAHFVPSDIVEVEQPIYFWMFDNGVANDTALTNLNATFSVLGNAVLQYQSCLEGYPFNSANTNWRKASMERRNSPTSINYIPSANNDLGFEASNMRGIQVKQPFQRSGLENTLIFNIPSTGYKDIKFAFALKDENAASGVIIEYSVSSGNPVWVTTGLSAMPLPITSDYQRFEADFSDISLADDTTNLKVRLRFTGTNMTADNGDRVTLNNVSVLGTSLTAGIKSKEELMFTVYPNPVASVLTVAHPYEKADYWLYSVDGKLINQGVLKNQHINMEYLQSGIYLLKVSYNGKSLTKKIVKQ